MSSRRFWLGPMRPRSPSSSASPGQLPRLGRLPVFCAPVQPRTFAFAERGVGITAMVARRVRALQLLVAERSMAIPACHRGWGGPETARLFVVASRPWLCQILASPLALCLGSLPARHCEPTAPTVRLPRRWDWQGFARSVRKRIGGDRGRQTGKCPQ